MKKLFRWIRSFFVSAPPVPTATILKLFDKPPARTFGMTRRQFFVSAGATLAVTAAATIKLDRLMPLEDSWRFGWIREAGLLPVYYGIDMDNPVYLKVWLDGDEISFDRLKAMAGYHGACAEINISQGHAGMKATGGFRMLPGDEEDFDVNNRAANYDPDKTIDAPLEEMLGKKPT